MSVTDDSGNKGVDQVKLDNIIMNLMLTAHQMHQPINSPRNGILQHIPFIECDQFVDAKSRTVESINNLVYILVHEEQL